MLAFKNKNNLLKPTYFAFIFLFFSVQSCAQTPIGEELSRSFNFSSNELNNDVNEREASMESIDVIIVEDIQSSEELNNNEEVEPRLLVQNDSNSQNNSYQVNDSEIPEYTPQPYRITIKLSSANPSAPAESVTKALRMSGVLFEVEKIERIDPKPFIEKVTFTDLSR